MQVIVICKYMSVLADLFFVHRVTNLTKTCSLKKQQMTNSNVLAVASKKLLQFIQRLL